MSIQPRTNGVSHLALRVSDLHGARQFYEGTLGLPVVLEADGLLAVMAGGTLVALRGPTGETPAGDSFNPFRVGMDHVALGCSDVKELNRVAKALQHAGVKNTGVKDDDLTGKKYVAFKDPDNISWEFYMS
jgi:catechol 2,3-dioxygenase-like lactoylglutathione lyase family enzyme